MSHPSDIDFEDLSPSPLLQITSLSMVIAGVMRAAVGFQLLFIVRLVGTWSWVPYVMLLLGGVAFVVGATAGRGRLWASWASLIAAGLLVVLGAIWEIYAVTHGLFSLLSALAVLTALPSAVLAGLSIQPARRLHSARQKLLE